MAANAVEVWFDRRAVGADQKQIGRAHQPHRAFWKDRRERPHDRSQIALADVVRMRPLTQEPVGLQARARRLEELPRE